MKKLFIHSFETEMGIVRTAATSSGLAIVTLPGDFSQSFERQIEREFSDYQYCADGKINRQAAKEIKAFLCGKIKKFSVSLDLRGTPFQKKVLRKVSMIPYGKTMSYGEIASAVGHPRASRAVGTVNAHNVLPLLIPCHRVVAANGIGGYGGGTGMKKKLLKFEGVEY